MSLRAPALTLYLLAALALACGVVALALAAGPTTWADLVEGWGWYTARKLTSPIVGPVLGLTAILGGVVVVVALRARRADAGADEPTQGEPDTEQLVLQARRNIDLEVCRPRPSRERVVDALMFVPLDVGAARVAIEPGAMVADVALELDGSRRPVTTMPLPLYEAVLQQLRLMAGVGEHGEGVVELQSPHGAEQVLVSVAGSRQTPRPEIWLEFLSRLGGEGGPGSGAGRRRTASSVAFRLDQQPLTDVRTGELQAMPTGEHDVMDKGSGLLTGFDPSAENQIAPLVTDRAARPPPGPTERRLRFALAAAAAVSALAFFGEAYGWGVVRLTEGHAPAPWRDVVIEVRSTPLAGDVTIMGRPRGRTPLRTRVPCRGLPIEVLVRAEGHVTWQWSGLCPRRGPLRLQADLNPIQ